MVEHASGSSRTPWVIAGVLGCLVLCMAFAVLAGGAYMYFNVKTPPTPFVLVIPTQVQLTLATTAPGNIPTLPPASPSPFFIPTQAITQPTVPSVPTSSAPRPTATSAPRPIAAPAGKIAFSRCEDICDLNEKKSIWLMNADGTNARKIVDIASDPALSPDGTRIAYYHLTDGIFVANIDGSNARKFVGDTKARGPAWSHDGKWIAFAGLDAVPSSVPANETPQRRPLVLGGGSMPTWSPDDSQLVLQACRDQCGLFKAGFSGDPVPSPMIIIGDDGSVPSFSPDGKRILYQKEADGERQLFIINVDGTGKKQLTVGPTMHVSANWSLDGNFIFYRSPEGGTWAIWRMNADGTNRVKVLDSVPPVDWAFERLSVSK
jgi:dipeptidyl aminopeptidase/acylaminoacyl peptidase